MNCINLENQCDFELISAFLPASSVTVGETSHLVVGYCINYRIVLFDNMINQEPSVSQISDSNDWLPALGDADGPRYLAFVQALENDVQTGVLKPGTRLLPQRDMANQLGLSVGTVSRAYAEAEARGLVSGEVGRGTFVQRRRLPVSAKANAQATINLALNVPPATGEDELITSVLSEILADGALSPLLGYLPHQGLPSHREIMADWLAAFGVKADIANLFITHGGPACALDRPQHGGGAKGHGADGTVQLFRHDRTVGAERIPASRCRRRR
jgi:DNA-binding transcriptional regulator YhcF (GntR family)